MGRCRLALLLAAVAAAVLATGAGAASTRIFLRVSPTIVSRGAIVRVYGNADGCPRGDVVTVLSRAFSGPRFAGVPTISARVRAGGAFSARGRIRRLAARGRYGATARCGGGNLGVTAFFRVR